MRTKICLHNTTIITTQCYSNPQLNSQLDPDVSLAFTTQMPKTTLCYKWLTPARWRDQRKMRRRRETESDRARRWAESTLLKESSNSAMVCYQSPKSKRVFNATCNNNCWILSYRNKNNDKEKILRHHHDSRTQWGIKLRTHSSIQWRTVRDKAN